MQHAGRSHNSPCSAPITYPQEWLTFCLQEGRTLFILSNCHSGGGDGSGCSLGSEGAGSSARAWLQPVPASLPALLG